MLRGPYIFACLLPLSMLSCSGAAHSEVVPSILTTRGEVSFSAGGAGSSAPVNTKTRLTAGSSIKTSNNGELDLSLIPGALVTLLGSSELRIEQLSISKDGNETASDAIRDRVARVQLRQGATVVLFDGAANFIVSSDEVTAIALPGCLFRMDVDQHRTRITCVRGNLSARHRNGGAVQIEAGYFREWPSENGSRPSSEDSVSEQARISAVTTANELQALGAARQDQLPEE